MHCSFRRGSRRGRQHTEAGLTKIPIDCRITQAEKRLRAGCAQCMGDEMADAPAESACAAAAERPDHV